MGIGELGAPHPSVLPEHAWTTGGGVHGEIMILNVLFHRAERVRVELLKHPASGGADAADDFATW